MSTTTAASHLPEIPRAYPTGAEFGGQALFWLATLLAIAAEAAGLHLLLAGDLLPALALHAAAALLLWFLAWRALRRDTGVRLMFLLALSVTMLGPLGAVGTVIGALALAWTRRHATPFADWYRSIFPVEERSLSQQIYDSIRGGREDDALATAVGSFIDIMHNGTSRQKQVVIALIARNYRPSFSPALLEALNDEDPSVRVQAASATAFVEHSLSQRLVELSRAAAEAPEDADAQLALARHLDLYAISGLADADRSAELRRRAAAGYRAGLAAHPDDPVLRLEFGRLLVRLGEPEEAAQVFAGLHEQMLLGDIAPWYAECLYRTGRLDELRAFCERAQDHGEARGLPPRPRIQFWARRGPEGGDIRARAARQQAEEEAAGTQTEGAADAAEGDGTPAPAAGGAP